MVWDVVKAAVHQPKERIGGQMLPYLRRNDGHGKPRHENIKLFKSGGIFASRFTKGQYRSLGEHWAWRLGGNCCSTPNSVWALLRPLVCCSRRWYSKNDGDWV